MRKFTILDAMILVAASAVVMLGARRILAAGPDEYAPIFATAEYFPWPDWLILGHRIAGMALMVGSIAMPILRLIPPRPRARRVIRQPGAVACFFAACCSLLNYAGQNVAEWSVRLSTSHPKLNLLGIPTTMMEFSASSLVWGYLIPEQSSVIPWVVATAWISLRLGRGGRPERSWVDRGGRSVGWAWIAWGIVGAFH